MPTKNPENKGLIANAIDCTATKEPRARPCLSLSVRFDIKYDVVGNTIETRYAKIGT